MAKEEGELFEEITKIREGKKSPKKEDTERKKQPPAHIQRNSNQHVQVGKQPQDEKTKPSPYAVEPSYESHGPIKQPNVFTHQARFQQQLFLENIYWKHIRTNKDCFILLEADKGYGKSTLGTVLGIRWVDLMRQYINYPIKFNLAKHIVYDDNVDHILEKINKLPKGSPVVFDEGGRIILGEDWNKKENKKIKKLFAEIRTKHLLVFVNCPFAIGDIDRKYLQNFFDFWIHLWGTGFGTIFMKNRHPMKKGFQIDTFDNVLPQHVPDVNTMRELYYINNFVKTHPCYYDIILWRPLSRKVYDQYQKLRDDAVYNKQQTQAEVDEEMSLNYKIRRDKFMLLRKLREQGYTWKQLVEIQNRGSLSSLREFYKKMEEDVIAREGSL